MNISSEISSIHGFNSSVDFSSNGTKVKFDFEMLSASYVISFLFGLSLHSYVIWLIVTGTGNGLVAEFFTFNISVYEIILSVESFFFSLAYKFEILWIVVGFLDGFVITGRPLFQCLISVERYLAVVHPVIFLKFKPLRYRLMCSAVIWMISFTSAGCDAVIWILAYELYVPFFIALLFVFFSVQLFCCVSVLRVLKQSGPGERGREREEENTMKKRAFYFILITTVSTIVLYTLYSVLIFVSVISDYCISLCVSQFCYVLAGLVEPALFLYRVGKLSFTRFYNFSRIFCHPAAVHSPS